MPLGEILSRQAKNQPDKKALIFQGKALTFKELNQLATSLAGGLTKLGIKSGDRIALLLPNSPEYIYSYFAIFQTGAIAVPVNSFLTPSEISYILENSGASLLITSQTHYTSLYENKALPENVKNIILTDGNCDNCFNINNILQNGKDAPPITFQDNGSPAIIIYTSGTTGRPKGAVLTHNNLLANIKSCAVSFPLKESDRFLVFLPLFHSFTLTVSMLLPIYIGARIILLPGILRDKIREAIIKERPTILIGIPQVYNMFANLSVSVLARFLNPIRIYISGGAPLPLEIHKKMEEKYRVPLLEGYGLSEASPVVSINPVKKRKPGSVGLPLDKVEVKIDEPKDGAGELLVRGPNVMEGYWQNQQATEEVIKDGWLYTGDVARIDDDGYIYIVDRKKEMLIVHGMNVYPREIEDVLYKHPAVLEAAVIGVPNTQKGEEPKAFIVLKENQQAGEDEIRHFCRQFLAAYKIPHIVEFRKELPKTGSGKILKRQLKAETVKGFD